MANFFKASKTKTQNSKLTSSIAININKLDMNGTGVGTFQKKPIFVDGCLPQESVEVRLIEQKNRYARAKLISVNKASPHRVKVECVHFSHCGGCNLQPLAYNQQLEFKVNKVTELFSRSGIDKQITEHLPWLSSITSDPWHYRRKARIGVQFTKNGDPIIGFRQKSTNQLVAVKYCPTLVKPIADIFPKLQTMISQLSVKKAIGHIEVIYTQNDNNEEIISLVVRQLRTLNEHDLNVWQHSAEQHNWQVLFDLGAGDYQSLASYPTLHYQLANKINIVFSHDDFIQVNHQVNQAMIEQAMTWLALEDDDQLLDLFCGLGNFSLPIAKKIKSLVGVEGVQAMVDKAQANASSNQLDNCEFYQADLNSNWLDSSWAKLNFTKAILDPARAGAEQAIVQLVTLGIKQILYVSCDPATLARDSQLLIAQGYKIIKIGLVDMFSQTKHVETMVLFAK